VAVLLFKADLGMANRFGSYSPWNECKTRSTSMGGGWRKLFLLQYLPLRL